MALDDGKYRAIIPGDIICVSYTSMFIHKCCIRFHLVDWRVDQLTVCVSILRY